MEIYQEVNVESYVLWCQRHSHLKEMANLLKKKKKSVFTIKTASAQNVLLYRVKEGERMASKTEKRPSISIV